jgi:uncharacterized protein (DUF58 family)
MGGGSQGFRWRAAPRLRRLGTVSLLAVIAAAVTGHAALLLLAAPAVAVLALSRGQGAPETLSLAAATSATRCFEGEPVQLTVTLAAPQVLDEVSFVLEPESTVSLLEDPPAQAVVGADRAEARWALRPRAWGRRVPATVRVRCRYGGIWQADLELAATVLEIFPHPPPARAWLVPAELRRRIGEHPSRNAGGGIEFAGIREYVPGDRLRDLNWAVSSRRGRLHANQRAAELAADLVVMIDGFSEVGPPGDSTVDVAVRGAAAVATAYLRSGDRVGAVVLGGLLRWLSPGAGTAQFYRIAEMVFDVRNDSVVTPDLDRIPRTALPPGALVILFSPLLDERAIGAVTDLRQRGFSLIVVDVLRHEPPVIGRSQVSALALRLWRLDRAALRSSLAGLGVPVVTWDSDDGLDAALAPLRRIPVSARPS